MSLSRSIGRKRSWRIRKWYLFGIVALCYVIGHVLVIQYSVLFDKGSVRVVTGYSEYDDDDDDVTTDRRHVYRDVISSSRINVASLSITSQTTNTLDDLIFDDEFPPSIASIEDRRIRSGDELMNLMRTSDRRDTYTDALSRRADTVPHQHHHHHHPSSYQFNCSNIGRIVLKHKLGHGITKHVYLGIYGDRPAAAVPGGDDARPPSIQRVAVKMVTRNVVDVVSCIRGRSAPLPQSPSSRPLPPSSQVRRRRLDDTDRNRRMCYIPPNMKLMKEILMHDQLRHPGLVPLLGYCARSEETESTSVANHGVVGVYAYAERFYASSLLSWSIRRRLAAAHQLADLLDYLERSPLGSLRIADFKESHFLLLPDGDDVDGKRIVMTDLDDLTSVEPPCVDDSSPTRLNVDGPHDRKQCDYGVTVCCLIIVGVFRRRCLVDLSVVCGRYV